MAIDRDNRASNAGAPNGPTGQQVGYLWPAILLCVGLLVAYVARLFELVNQPELTTIASDPSAVRLLAQAGEVFWRGHGGLFVLVAAALIVRYRPPMDGVRNAVRASSVIVLVGSVATVLSTALFDDSVSIWDRGDWVSSLLLGAGVPAVQAAVALVVLAFERRSAQVPTIAVAGLLASSVMGLSSGIFIGSPSSHELDDSMRIAQYFSGGDGMEWLPLLAAASLVAMTGQAGLLRGLVLSVAAATVVVTSSFVVLSSRITTDSDQFASSSGLTAPAAILTAVIAAAIALVPFDRVRPRQ